MKSLTLLLLISLLVFTGCTALDNMAKAENARLSASAWHHDPRSRSPSLPPNHASFMAARGEAHLLRDEADPPVPPNPEEDLSHDAWLASVGLAHLFPRRSPGPLTVAPSPVWTPPPWYAGYSLWNSVDAALMGSYGSWTKIYADGTKWRHVGPFGEHRGKIYGDGTKIRVR